MKKTTLAFALCILWTSTESWADIRRCHEIKEKEKRLSCYDAETNYFRPSQRIIESGDWIIQRTTSKIDDSTNVFLRLPSYDQTNCRYKRGNHNINIACRENKTSLWITFSNCFMSDNSGRGRVTYRIDTNPASTISMRESTDHMALGLWSGGTSIRFIKSLLGHNKLLIRATPFSESAVTGEYNITGLDEAIRPLREACNW